MGFLHHIKQVGARMNDSALAIDVFGTDITLIGMISSCKKISTGHYNNYSFIGVGNRKRWIGRAALLVW